MLVETGRGIATITFAHEINMPSYSINNLILIN